eukprot:1673301-Alexandrium_andersonii.AAC.1
MPEHLEAEVMNGCVKLAKHILACAGRGCCACMSALAGVCGLGRVREGIGACVCLCAARHAADWREG